MDPRRFDTLVKSLSSASTRRGLVRLLAALPLGVTLTALLGAVDETDAKRPVDRVRRRAQGRQQRRQQRRGDGTNKGHSEPSGKGKGKRKGKTTTPDPGCTPITCAAQGKTCGFIPNGCGGPELDCGACDPSGVRCCVDGACLPDPADCLPIGTECDPTTTCNDCCTQTFACCFPPDNHGVCAPAFSPGRPCTSQADCADPLQCACGTCCCSACAPGDITDLSPCNTTYFPDCVECP